MNPATADTQTTSGAERSTQPARRIEQIDRYWRAANYLGAAQLYLRDNPLLREPLRAEHIKPRLLGHWGTQPGQNLVYAHLDRLIQDEDCPVLLVDGPGHGAPAVLANLYLEGTLGEYDSDLGHGPSGLRRLMRQFSWPGGVPSHLNPGTPGALHEGGELGYSLAHAFGAVLDNPDLIAACIVGDGEAETGPLGAAWHSNKYLDPATCGAVLPILHLNGYKLSGPSLLARLDDEEITALCNGYGYAVSIVAGDDPARVHPAMWQAIDWAYHGIRDIQERARRGERLTRPRWPMIVLRTPKGWTGPKLVDGHPVEGTYHAHQVPLNDATDNPEHLAALETWLRSYDPEELFDDQGRPHPETLAVCPAGDRRMGMNPHANGGQLLRDLNLPDYADYALAIPSPGAVKAEATRVVGTFIRDVFRDNEQAANFRFFCPDETTSNRMEAIFEATERAFQWPLVSTDEFLSPGGRVMEVLSEHNCQGWLEGYLLSGRHGLFACYEAFIPIIDSMLNQYAKWLKVSRDVPWRKPLASLNYLLTSHVWRQDHNGYSHQVPSFLDTVANKKRSVARVYLPPDANCLLSVTDHCLRSRDHVNLIVAGKQLHPQWLTVEEASDHCRRGISAWEWASNDEGRPDVILACAGDVPTEETIAAADLLRRELPSLRVRVINVVDLLSLMSPHDHPHGIDERTYADLFPQNVPVVFAFHGYPRLVHEVVHHRPNAGAFHVHGYKEEGTTTTPFDMLVVNHASRYHLAMDAARFGASAKAVPGDEAGRLNDLCEERLAAHHSYIREHDEDLPEVVNWQWGGGR